MRAAWTALTPTVALDAARRHLTAENAWVAIVAPNARELAEAIRTNAPSPITYETPRSAQVLAEDREIAAYRLPVASDGVRVVPLAEVFH